MLGQGEQRIYKGVNYISKPREKPYRIINYLLWDRDLPLNPKSNIWLTI